MIVWYRLIDNAQIVPELVAVAHDYLATWTPEEIALLPVPCRPVRIRDEVDIEDLNARLAEEYRNSNATGEEFQLLRKMTGFAVRATMRIAQLRGDRSEDDGEEPHEPPQQSADSPKS